MTDETYEKGARGGVSGGFDTPLRATQPPLTKNDARDKKPNKLCSAKLWITIWAMAMVTFIIIAGKSEFNSVLMMLAGVPVAYMGVNVWQKHIYASKEKDEGAGELFDTLFPKDGKCEWSADTQKEAQ